MAEWSLRQSVARPSRNREAMNFLIKADHVTCPLPTLGQLMPHLLKAAALASGGRRMPREGPQWMKQQTHSSGDIPVQDQ
jgi:hypothetical protein